MAVNETKETNIHKGDNTMLYYPKNDLKTVYAQWDPDLQRNVPTENNHYTKYKEGD